VTNKPKIDVSSLPVRVQIALQRYEKIANARQARLSAFLQTQPATAHQSGRREAIVQQIKAQVESRAALTSKVAEHYDTLHALFQTSGGPEKAGTEKSKPAFMVAPSSSSKKTSSTAD
jgi:hypothetical protein